MCGNKCVLSVCKDLKGIFISRALVGKRSYRNSIMRAGAMTHQEKALVAKPEVLSLIPWNYMEEGERTNLLPSPSPLSPLSPLSPSSLSLPFSHTDTHACMHAQTHLKNVLCLEIRFLI